jgi:hypothetical protein
MPTQSNAAGIATATDSCMNSITHTHTHTHRASVAMTHTVYTLPGKAAATYDADTYSPAYAVSIFT